MKRPWIFIPPKTEDEIFKFVQFLQQILGSWAPKGSNRLFLYSLGIFHIIINLIITVGQYAFVYFHPTNLVVILEVLCPATTMGVTTFKHCVMLWRTNELDEIYQSVKKAFRDGLFLFLFIFFFMSIIKFLIKFRSH